MHCTMATRHQKAHSYVQEQEAYGRQPIQTLAVTDLRVVPAVGFTRIRRNFKIWELKFSSTGYRIFYSHFDHFYWKKVNISSV